MKITVYQRRPEGWRVFREYYWFPVKPGTEPDSVATNKRPRYPCPGCDKSLTEDALREHHCLGGSADYPRLRKSQKLTDLDEHSKQILLAEYQRNNPNVVVDTRNDG